MTRAVLRAVGTVLRVTSANRSGEPPARTAADAARALGTKVALILDAGPAPGGVPSTVVKVEGDHWQMIREGAITARQLTAAIEAHD